MTDVQQLSYRGLIDQATAQLFAHSDSPRIDAEVLLQSVVGQPLAWLIAHGNDVASVEHRAQFAELIEERQLGKPIAYILGQKEFWTLNLQVNEAVLIPRGDTETLVEQALHRLACNTPLQILELGTGSGAISLALARERPLAQVLAIDSEAEALGVAKSNARRCGIGNVSFVQSNWFTNISVDSQFDMIVANPPYIDQNDPHLNQGDLRFEPASALVSAEQGMADLREIIAASPAFLRTAGWLLVEHGYDQPDRVAAAFAAANFVDVELFPDINGLPRCTAGRIMH